MKHIILLPICVLLLSCALLSGCAKTESAQATVTLQWEAPVDIGADGQQQACASYELLYTNDPSLQNMAGQNLRLSDFVGSRAFVDNLPIPAEPGTMQEIVITLETNRVYYFAMAAVDPSGNWSAISNVPEHETGDAIPPQAIINLRVKP